MTKAGGKEGKTGTADLIDRFRQMKILLYNSKTRVRGLTPNINRCKERQVLQWQNDAREVGDVAMAAAAGGVCKEEKKLFRTYPLRS